MQTVKLLVVAGVALQAAAQTRITTETGIISEPPLESLGVGTACATVVSSLAADATDAPVPDRSISNIAMAFALGRMYNTEDPCKLPTITERDSASAFTAWASSYTEWQSDQIPDYRQVWTACSDEPHVSEIIPIGSSVCRNLAAEITRGSTSDNDGDNDGDSDDGSDGSNSNDNDGGSDDGNTGLQQAVPVLSAAVVAGLIIVGLY
ncbi:hypothetical protein CEP54_016375 [Fusarium duplospermum]|uniref:Infection structure specific protein n=1 Tax=Fusarium duplospermum TaxID=1325734 RepID=A0A428NE58_9HYPO|nr:hypothetical protein CEP54_016375 [Fusarium duplospermum]